MDTAEWRQRLEATFTKNGVIVGKLQNVIAAEKVYPLFVQEQFYDNLLLVNSFLTFFAETLTLASDQYDERPDAPCVQSCGSLLVNQTANFRRFRAAENLLYVGYSLSGFALLRDLKDQALILGALCNGSTTYSEMIGVDNDTVPDGHPTEANLGAILARKKREERHVRSLMLGRNSGLEDKHRQMLKLWEDMFHREVHGSQVTMAVEGRRWMEGKGPLPILPSRRPKSGIMYVNRSSEIGWMLLRTLPFLQLKEEAFGLGWAHRWTVLDESFRYMVAALDEIGKEIGGAIIHLVDSKFPFTPEQTHYVEWQSELPQK